MSRVNVEQSGEKKEFKKFRRILKVRVSQTFVLAFYEWMSPTSLFTKSKTSPGQHLNTWNSESNLGLIRGTKIHGNYHWRQYISCTQKPRYHTCKKMENKDRWHGFWIVVVHRKMKTCMICSSLTTWLLSCSGKTFTASRVPFQFVSKWGKLIQPSNDLAVLLQKFFKAVSTSSST